MENLFLCEVELRSLADLEKFKNIIYRHISCKNVPDFNEEKCTMEIKITRGIFVKVIVDRNELDELKKWFYIARAKESVCFNDMLYTLYE